MWISSFYLAISIPRTSWPCIATTITTNTSDFTLSKMPAWLFSVFILIFLLPKLKVFVGLVLLICFLFWMEKKRNALNLFLEILSPKNHDCLKIQSCMTTLLLRSRIQGSVWLWLQGWLSVHLNLLHIFGIEQTVPYNRKKLGSSQLQWQRLISVYQLQFTKHFHILSKKIQESS